MSTATARPTALDQLLKAARARGDNAEVVSLWLKRAVDLGTGFRRATSEPARIVPSGGSRSAYGHAQGENESFMRLHAMEKADHRPTVILNRAVFEKLRDMRYGLEDGYWLVGPGEQEPRAVEITRAMWPAMPDDRAPASLAVEWGDVRAINEALDDYRRRVIGHAHSQPSGSWPSEGDFRAWENGLHYSNPFVGVVVGERLNPHDPVDVRAFVVSREGGSVSHQSAEIFWRGME